MLITLNPGEVLNIQFAECDGEFAVHFDTSEYPQALVVKEMAGLPGSVKGGAEEILYHEAFGSGAPAGLAEECYEDGEALVTKFTRTPSVGFFMDRNNVVHSTQLVNCHVVMLEGQPVVNTLSADDTVTGTFDFYETMEELEAELGHSYPQLTI